jgi:hypothetical protein
MDIGPVAPTLTLRQAALKAIETHRTREATQKVETARRDRENAIFALKRALKRDLSVDVEPRWSDDRAEAVVDGLLFITRRSTWSSWENYASVMLPCQACSIPLPCQVSSMESLGALLSGGTHQQDHWNCPAKPPAEAAAPPPAARSTAEQLVDLLERFIAERTPVQG